MIHGESLSVDERSSWREELADGLNFLATNCLPRRTLTRLVGWISKLEHPWVVRPGVWLWQRFGGELDLEESTQIEYPSIHAVFTRALKPGAREIDPRADYGVSPCDGIVGSSGEIVDGQLVQVKGAYYSLAELLRDASLAHRFERGRYVTLRLTSVMYHRFHAPADARMEALTYIAGDVWNVNPPALKRVAKLYCRNERVVLPLTIRLGGREIEILLVAVAAILVGGIRLRHLEDVLNTRYIGPEGRSCPASFSKGEEMGWFEHGSTILVITPAGTELATGLHNGQRIQLGQALFRFAQSPTSTEGGH